MGPAPSPLRPASIAELAQALAALARSPSANAVAEALAARELADSERAALREAHEDAPLATLAAARVRSALAAPGSALDVAVESAGSSPRASRTERFETVPLRTQALVDEPELRVRVASPDGDASIVVPSDLAVLLGALLEREPAQREAKGSARGWVPSELVGRVLGGTYRLRRLLGRGGFGAVFEASDDRAGLEELRYAVKVLDPRKFDDASDRESFFREFKNTQRCRGENIIATNQVEATADGLLYYSMELLEGRDLEVLARDEGTLSADRTGEILLAILRALRVAHEECGEPAVLHLDLKPSNVFLARARDGSGDGTIKVLDFGISQHASSDAGRASATDSGRIVRRSPSGRVLDTAGALTTAGGASATMTRSRFCTPAYASPEHCAHWDASIPEQRILPLDARSDLYSLGVIGYRLLTGKLPFDPRELDTDGLVRAKLELDPPSVRAQGVAVPRRLAAFVDKCVARDRDERWRSTSEAYAELERIVRPKLTWKRAALVGAPVLAATIASAVYFAPESYAANQGELRVAATGALPSASEPLYLGAGERSSVDLRWDGVDLAIGASVAFRARGGGEGWELTALEPGAFRLAWTGSALGTVSTEGWLEAELDAGAFRRHGRWLASPTFRAFVLDPAALTAPKLATSHGESSAPIGEGETVLDPYELALRVDVAGVLAEVLERRVDVTATGSEPFACEVDWKSSGDGSARAEIELGALASRLGDRAAAGVDLAVTVRDRAGNERTTQWRVRFVAEELQFSKATLAMRGEPVVSPKLYRESPLALSLAANRPARSTWRVFERQGLKDVPVCVKEHVVDDGGTVDDVWKTCPDLSPALDGRDAQRAEFAEFVLVAEATDDASIRYGGGAAAARRRAGSELPFRVNLKPPTFVAALAAGDASASATFDAIADGASLYVPDGLLTLRVTPAANVDTHIEFTCTQGERTIFREEREARSDTPVRFGWSLPEDGRYAVEIRGGAGGDAASSARVAFTLVRDTVDPRCVRSEPDAPFVLDAATPRRRFGFAYDDAQSGSARWSWRRAGTTEALLAGASGPLEPGAAFEIDVDARAFPGDGEYELLVSATDAASRAHVEDAIRATVAVAPPEIVLVQPSPLGTTWQRSGDAWRLEVSVRDPNGLDRAAGVRATLKGPSGPALHVPLAPVDGSAASVDGGSFRGLVTLPPAWSKASVELFVEAQDARGNRTPLDALDAFVLDEIEAVAPECIEWTPAGESAPIARMRFVRGNGGSAGGAYCFRGESDRNERARFEKAGISAAYVDPKAPTERSWGLRYEAGEIADAYVDEREVSNAELLRFLAAGARDPRWWPAAPSSPSRIAELERRIAQLPGDLPVAGVTWDEAFAYAAWTGRRLLSVVEWEYALRGGREYRAFAAESRDVPRAKGAVVFERDAPLAVGTSRDRTPVTMLWDLSGNVREWTASPYRFDDDGERVLKTHWERHRPDLLAPRANGRSSYWVAGASFRTSSEVEELLTFVSPADEPRDAVEDDLGFRCALSATAELLAKLADGADLERAKPCR